MKPISKDLNPLNRVAVYSEKQFQCGASIAALRISEELAHQGLEVQYNFENPNPKLEKSHRFKSLEFNRLSGSHSNSAKEALKIASNSPDVSWGYTKKKFFEQHLRMTLKRGDVDVAHLHNYSGSRETVSDIANNKPLVWTMHDASPVTGFHYRTYDIAGEPLEYRSKTDPASSEFWDSLVQQPFALTAPSKWLAEYASSSVPDHVMVRHIPNVVPPSHFYPMDQGLARALIGIPQGPRFILFFAGTGAWKRKNFEILARAFAKAPDLPINAIVVGGVAGDQLMRDRRFRFMDGFDPVNDAAKIVALYNAVDAFCISSLIDNLPNTVLEAIHCGKPVIGSDVGGIPDMVIDGENGWLFDPRDVDSVVASLKRFCDDVERLPEMSAASLRLAEKSFSPKSVTTAFCDLYEELVEVHEHSF